MGRVVAGFRGGLEEGIVAKLVGLERVGEVAGVVDSYLTGTSANDPPTLSYAAGPATDWNPVSSSAQIKQLCNAPSPRACILGHKPLSSERFELSTLTGISSCLHADLHRYTLF